MYSYNYACQSVSATADQLAYREGQMSFQAAYAPLEVLDEVPALPTYEPNTVAKMIQRQHDRNS